MASSSSFYRPSPFRRILLEGGHIAARRASDYRSAGPLGKYLVQFTIVFAAYFIAGKLGQATTHIRSSNLGPVWPAYGIALSAILVCGYRIWPAVGAGAFLVALLSPESPLTALGQATGGTLAALTGTFLLRRLKFDVSLSRLRDALGLVLLGAMGSAMVSASIGVLVLYASNVHAYSGLGSAWLIYWLGDGTGVLLITPLALTFPSLSRIRDQSRITELAVLLLVISGTCLVIFGDVSLVSIRLHFLAFAVLPLVMLAAIRFTAVGASLSILLAATIATVETAMGSGPFAYESAFQSAVLLDVFFWILSVSGMMLASLIMERENAERERELAVGKQATMEALADVSRKLVETQERERTRIARELHDDINQRLAMVTIELEQLEEKHSELPTEVLIRMHKLQEETAEISADVQALSHELHSSGLEYLGAIEGMKNWCEEFSERQRVEIDFSSDVANALSPEVGLSLFRVLQEALHNALKYSGVRRVDVCLAEHSGEVHLTVSDAGKGFDVDVAKQGRGLGLTSMQERVRLVHGTITIESKPMGGTTIRVRIPAEPGRASQARAV